MTPKRFTLKEIDNFSYGIKVTDIIMDNHIELPQSTVCELLNELHETNEQLRILTNIKNTNAKDLVDVLNIQENKIWNLEKEHEQLKKECKELRDWIDDITTKYKEQRGIDLENDLD